MERKKKSRVQTIPLSVDIDLYSDTDEQSKQVQMLYDRINRLDIFDRAIILLWLENMPYQDIANVVGISLSAVTTRLFRIREQLKSMSNK
jgi:RNA polymerase sigma-70 factor (ECF subfamily)